jgi:hypothetical protein
MADEIIPEDVKQFFLQYIDSIAQWEGLLLLRANPQVKWSAGDVARNLYIDEAQAVKILNQLLSQGFVVAEGSGPLFYRYQPKPPEIEPLMVRAAALYAQYLVPVTHLIHTKAKSRIQEFADAFRLRKD